MKKFIYLILCIFIAACSLPKEQTPKEPVLKEQEQKDPCAIFSKDILNLAKEDPYFFYIVDKKYLLSEEYAPQDLMGKGKSAVREHTYNAFKEMQEAAKKEGLNIWILSGFRPYQRQEAIYQSSLKRRGQEHTSRYVAKPGASQHQLGTAIDINNVHDTFVNTKEYAWLKDNAGKFGFSLSFPQGQEEKTGYAFEPWHYRYITSEGTHLQKEYFNDSQVDFLDALNACLK